MFPWFIERLASSLARALGLQVVTRARVGAFGFDRLYVQRPGTPRETRLG